MKYFLRACIALLLCLPLIGFAASALPPVINEYSSIIKVQKDASLIVTEQVIITTAGRTVRHGIYRDFPTLYRGRHGGTVKVGFDVLSTKLDGKKVQHHTKDLSNGVRVYLGSKSMQLPAGKYTFEITYKTTGQLGFFKDHDELYWNVTGNGWAFPIDQVEAWLELPDGARNNILKYTAYTGAQGQRGTAYLADVNKEKQVVFVTTRPLAAHQGLTIVVGWKPGFITQPSFWAANSKDLFVYLILIVGVILVFVYYLLMWLRHGRDPQAGAVMPEYYPPKGFTPAALRYILDMGYDNRVLSSAILNLAVKGALKIEQKNKKDYTLIKQKDFNGELSAAEKILMQKLFLGNDTLHLKKGVDIRKTIESYRGELKKEFEKTYFITNNTYAVVGAVISILAVGLGILLNFNLVPAAIFMLVFMFISMGNKGAVRQSLKSKLKQGGWSNIFTAVVIVLIIISFAPNVSQLDIIYPWLYASLLAVLVILNLVFVGLLKRLTVAGAHLIRQVKGFKMFLGATEKDRMNFRNPPDKTPELFEKYLPFALALGVEQKWGEQFSDVLAKANYQPQWFVGNYMLFYTGNGFTNSFADSFTSTVSSAASPPGSSSGFGGGGFSGGGGGGGGGGGW
ncbi:MAG: DUF2207 domain-containing protein [Coxiellaceae bacterium]|nr:DUF2207 domain-containing protein [Coxiellaceae bacterium]